MNSQLQSQDALTNLGALYFEGQGVPQSFERAVELWKQGASKGQPVSQRDQACKFFVNDSGSKLIFERIFTADNPTSPSLLTVVQYFNVRMDR